MIWDNTPNHDLGYTKLRFRTKFDLGPTYVSNRNVDLRHLKSEDRFGISQIAIWEIVGFGLQHIYYNATGYLLFIQLLNFFFCSYS